MARVHKSFKPDASPLLEIVCYIIAHPSIIIDKRNLFEGHSQYERFNKIFNEVVVTH